MKTQSPTHQITTEEEVARGRHHPLTGALHAHRILGAVAEKTVRVPVPKKSRRLSRCEAVLELYALQELCSSVPGREWKCAWEVAVKVSFPHGRDAWILGSAGDKVV